METSGPNEPMLSKTQLKKMKKKEKWLQYRGEKRKKEKERKRERRRVAIESGEDLGPSRKSLKLNTMEKSSCQVRVAIDCSFDDYMTDKDVKKLAKQLQTCYSVNRRSSNPLQFYLCSMQEKMKSALQVTGYSNWDVFSSGEKYTDVFDKESIVYLSSESPNMLDKLEEDKVYVIGGLVDHNHHKGLCLELAEEKGIQHAQLPITDYVEMKTRKVLAINHVFEILLKFSELKDWKESFFAAIPQRKGVTGKNLVGSSDNQNKKSNTESSDSEDDKILGVSEEKVTTEQESVRKPGLEKDVSSTHEENTENCDKRHAKTNSSTNTEEKDNGLDPDISKRDCNSDDPLENS